MVKPKQKTPEVETQSAEGKKVDRQNKLKNALTKAERDVILKAIKIYRHRIPTYLMSNEPEVRIVDNIIKKLS